MTRSARAPALVLVVVSALAACGAPPSSEPPPTSTAPAPATHVEGPIVATVDGEPISLGEVEATAQGTGLTPLAALHRLEQERVLLALARRASLVEDAESDDAARRAAVQALLRARVEDPIQEAEIDDAEVAARYEASRSAWARPERRASLHLLAAVPEGAPDAEAARAAATRFVHDAIVRLALATDPVAEAHVLEAEAAHRSFTVRVESIPATARHGSLEEPYLAALFAIPREYGVAPEPVTTSYGVHAIVLTSIVPSFEVPLEEAAPILRRQLVTEHRAAALDALTTELSAHTTVAIDERVAAGVFAADLDDVDRGVR